MPTIIGLFFFVTSSVLFFRKDDTLFGLVIFSAIFQASSIIALNEAGIEPYYAVASLFVLQSIYRGKMWPNASKPFKGKRWMIAFALIAVTSAFTLPFVFAGIPVYEQHIGLDDGLFIRPPLEFRNANISHSISLVLGVLVVLGAAQTFQGKSHVKNAYLFTFYFLAAVIGLQFLCSVAGIAFPYTLLQNHGGSSMQAVVTGDLSSRFSGTFTESSGAGLVLSGFTAGFLAEKLRYGGSLIPALIGLGAILLVRSTGSIVAIGVSIVLLALSQPVFRFPYVFPVRLMRVTMLIGAVAALTAAILFSPLRDSVMNETVSKQDTGSFINRTASDLYALDLFVRTHGIGVGMGSNRPSSLISSLLSTVGVLGLMLFLMTHFALISNAGSARPELRWAGFALFISMATSMPDYDAPWLWAFLAVAVQAASAVELPSGRSLRDSAISIA